MNIKYLTIKIVLFSSIILLVSCKNSKYSLSKKTKESLTVSIDSMYDLDQNIRQYYNQLDASYGIKRGTNLKNKGITKGTYKLYKKEKDSIIKVMKKTDNTNTLKLLKITDKYGFPSNERLGTYKAKAYMIFVHSDINKYGEKIEHVINTENKANRISKYKKAYIFWHLHGRKKMPPMRGKNGEVIW